MENIYLTHPKNLGVFCAAFQTHSLMAQDHLLMPKLIFGCLCITSLGVRTMCDGTEHKFSTEGWN